MRQSYSINEILNAVSDIKPRRGRPKTVSNNKILKARTGLVVPPKDTTATAVKIPLPTPAVARNHNT